APPDAALVEYAIAESFAATRAAGQFEDRAEAIANDLADGQPPEIVSRFRSDLLALRARPDLPQELGRRMQRVYASVLPGMLKPAPVVDDAVYFVIGNDKQLGAWQQYLKTAVGADTVLHRIYPRD